MSHEIRTPMNAIIGLSHLALKGDDLPPRHRDYIGKVHTAAGHLLGVINDILDFSKVEAGMLELENTEFDLAQLVTSTCSLVQPECDRKSLELSVDLEPGVPTHLVGDALRLGQVLVNFVNNAVKFTHTGSVIISARATEESESHVTLHIGVRDTGIGLTVEQMGRLFQSFSQADNSTTRKYGGTGLGLAISKKLVELMGGEVGVESGVGEGSNFWLRVRLPKAQPQASRDAELKIEVDPIEDMLANLPDLSSVRGSRVLLVEDNDINQMVARELLEEAGMFVEIANHGAQALEALQRSSFDLVFMDMQMPVMDGLQATREIREQEGFAHLPVVAMTANAMARDRETCLRAGMNDVVTKPIDPQVLWETLLKWLEPRQASTQAAAAEFLRA
jgi:CheY-like chemotaxis protein